jgi:hypothetical protein
MNGTKVVQARVSPEMAHEIEALAFTKGMILPSGEANVSAAVRHLLERALIDVRLRQGSSSKASNLTSRVQTVREENRQ